MKKLFTIIALAVICACTDKPAEENLAKLADPTDLSAQHAGDSSVVLTWTDNAQGEIGYRVFLRGENDPQIVAPVQVLDPDNESYTFKGLTPGSVYDFGVQAISSDMTCHSEVVYLLDCKVEQPKEEVPEVPVEPETPVEPEEPDTPSEPVEPSEPEEPETPAEPQVDPKRVPQVVEVKTSYAYIAVTYKVETLNGTNPEHGVCFCETGAPTVDDIKALGPALSRNVNTLQVVPNAYLEEGKEYQMSVFVKDGDTYNYSEPQTVKLDAQPDPVNLVWEKQTYAEAAGVEIFKTTSQLNGRNFNAWYAIADPKVVDFRVMYPEAVGTKKTVTSQAEAAGDCLVLINGAIFGNYNIGVIMTEGKMTQQWHGEIEGCHWADNSQLYQLTRAIIGVDAEGNAEAHWVGVPSQGTFYYYDAPMASVVGQKKYSKVSSVYPTPAVDWSPYYAISCGPMVLYDGKVSADNTMVDDTHYYTNYECWSESGVYSSNPDRTAVGVTADGKIVLFICDGRIDASKGAYIKELGPIMKSIGCVHAMNLDGGGSTGMWVKGAGMINHKDSSWRAVKSTLGFFKKQ